MRGQVKKIPESSDDLRSMVVDHVGRTTAALGRLRSALAELHVSLPESAGDLVDVQEPLELAACEIDQIYDTLVRLVWAARGQPIGSVPSPIAPSRTPQKRGAMNENTPVVYVVDDSQSVRNALDRLFRSEGYRTEAFASARQFIEASPDAQPACIVLDVRMPRMSGLDLQRELAARAIDLPIVFITGHGDIDMAVQAMKDGAVDFLPKPFEEQDLLDSVARALERHRQTHESHLRRQEVAERLDRLTPCERAVFERVVKGMLNKQIGFELGTTEKTVKVHRARVMEKMGAESLADLVRMAVRVGIEGPGSGRSS